MPNHNRYSRLLKPFPFQLIVFLLPLIVYHKTVHLSPVEISAWSGTPTNSDFYFYYRMVFLLGLTVLSLLLFISGVLKKEVSIRQNVVYYPLGVFVFFVILSAVFADHQEIAHFGFMDSYEGMWTLLSYALLFFIAFNTIDTEEKIKHILKFLLFSALIIAVIGVFQLWGWNFFASGFGRFLTIPAGMDYRYISLYNAHAVFSTFSNSNYLGCYLTLIFPMFFVLFTGLKNSF